jgi:hypothetical protein
MSDQTAYVSDTALDALAAWHGGQFTATYSVLSTGGGTPAKLRDAVRELDPVYRKIQDDESWSAADIEQLAGLIDELEYVARHPAEYYAYNPRLGGSKRKKKEACIWRMTHSDYKTTLRGDRYVLTRDKAERTVLVPLKRMTEAELDALLKGSSTANQGRKRARRRK